MATAASPWLLARPLTLVALAPRLPFLVVAATQVPLAAFLVVGTIRLGAGDPFHFLLGRRYGPAAVARLVRGRRWLGPWLERSALVAVSVRPIGRHLLLAGASGISSVRTGVADLVGTLFYLMTIWQAAALVT
ncbi:hypothetical protein BH20ACT2_BH20ACT2_14140 [soil metagenome]